jgi:hypothetical protein
MGGGGASIPITLRAIGNLDTPILLARTEKTSGQMTSTPTYLRTQLMGNEIAAAGVALKSGWIDAETALAMLSETGVVELIPT